MRLGFPSAFESPAICATSQLTPLVNPISRASKAPLRAELFLANCFVAAVSTLPSFVATCTGTV